LNTASRAFENGSDDWLIIVVVPERDFMDQINANTRNTIMLCLAAFAGDCPGHSDGVGSPNHSAVGQRGKSDRRRQFNQFL